MNLLRQAEVVDEPESGRKVVMNKSSNNLKTRLLVAVAVGLFLGVPPALAQVVTGSIVGTITDSSGAVVPAAKVTVTDLATNVPRVFTTDASGTYSVPDLPPGSYKVSAEKEGFTIGVHTDITLFAAQTVRVDISLQPGSVTQSVTVSGQATAMLQTDTAETGRDINTTQVEDLPLSQGHNFQNLLNLVPGIEPALRQHSTFLNPNNGMSAPAQGVPGRANNFAIEGINDMQHSGELPIYIPAMEAIQEVAVTATNYDPSQGAALGAVSNVIIKSGSNAFHGEAYEIYTGNVFDSRNFFAVGSGGKPYHMAHSVDNYFGGQVGGAIQKDKTFFFVDFFYHPTSVSSFFDFSVPTAALKQGLFTDPALPVIYDPTTGDEADCLPGGNAKLCGTGRTQIGASAGTPNILTPTTQATNLLSHILPCAVCTTSTGAPNYVNNLPYNSPLVQNTPDLDVKIDRYQGQHDHISGRFSWQDPKTNQPGIWGAYGGPISVGGTPGTEGTDTMAIYSVGINWVHVFSPSLLMEARVGLGRYNNVAFPSGYGQSLSTAVGIPGLDFNNASSGLLAINGEGFSDPLLGTFGNFPWIHVEDNIVFDDNWSKIHGNHTMTFGLDYYRVRDDYNEVSYQGGEMGFSAGPTTLNGGAAGTFANNFASFLLGIPSSQERSYITESPTYRQNQFFPYFGDKWQVTKKLTANLGLRWEYVGVPTSHFPGSFSNYIPSNNTLTLNGIGAIPMNEGIHADYRNWGPRVGLAYRLTGRDVLRAGFGMSSMPYPIDIYLVNYPIAPTQTWNDISSYGPALLSNTQAASFANGFPAVTPPVIPTNGIISLTGNPTLTSLNQYAMDPNWRNPYLISWNLAYERQLPGQWVLDVAYVGNRTVRAAIDYNINAATSYGSGAAGQPEYIPFGRTALTQLWFEQTRNAYDSLQVKVDHHFAHNFTVTTSYTWGKAIGPSGESNDYVNGLLDYVNVARNYAPTDFNIASMYSQSLVWMLPFGKGMPFLQSGPGNVILGGWELSGAWAAHTGFPLNFSTNSSSFNTPGNQQFPNESGPFTKLHGIGTANPWFDKSVFSFPAAGTQGNVGNYVQQGPGFFNMDAALSRTIKLNERFKLLLRTEWLHATNTPQFANPGTTYGSSSFGLVTSTTGLGGQRVIDMVGKLIF